MIRMHPHVVARVFRPRGGLVKFALGAVLIVMPALAAGAGTSEPEELYQLARNYDRADGVAGGSTRALTIYCRAARAGHWKAAFNVGWMRLDASPAGPADQAAGWLRAAPKHGPDRAAKWLRIVPRAGLAARDRCSPSGAPVDAPVGAAGIPAAPPKILAIVADLAPRFDVEPRLILSMIAVESSFRADAVSPKNARGLMQLMPRTAARFGVSNSFDPRQNIEGGMKYLRWLLDQFDGDKELALAAYNAGEQAVKKHGGMPPYDETRSYVKKVLRIYERAGDSGTGGTPVASLSPTWTATPHNCHKIGADKIVRPC